MDIMLDIETMGTGQDAAIIAIGAVAFKSYGVVDKFYTQVNLQSSIDAGCSVDGSTVMWWLKQSNEARAAFADNDSAPTIHDALKHFSYWYGKVNGEKVWGNGAMFDNAIMSNAYKKCEITVPWKFWNDMCYRTVKNMHKNITIMRTGTYHNALDDAESQANHLIAILYPPA